MPSIPRSPLKRVLLGDFSWLRVLRSAVLVYAVVGTWAWFASDGMIFPAPPSSYHDSADIRRIPVDGGESIAALYLPRDASRFVVLHSHGNCEDLGTIRPVLDLWLDWGFSVFAYDYRGYGLSDGRAGERHAYADAEAAYRYLTGTLGVAPSRIIVHGRSVGAALAIDLAQRHPVAGLIVESGFVSAFRVRTGVPIFPFDRFRNLDRIARVKCPVLVIHGADDDIVPAWHGRMLFDAARGPKRFLGIDGAGHNDVLEAGERDYRSAVAAFAGGLRDP